MDVVNVNKVVFGNCSNMIGRNMINNLVNFRGGSFSTQIIVHLVGFVCIDGFIVPSLTPPLLNIGCRSRHTNPLNNPKTMICEWVKTLEIDMTMSNIHSKGP